MSSTPAFIWSMFTTGADALDEAGTLFRATDNAIVDDAVAACNLINAALPGNPAEGLKNFIKSDPIRQEWEWFKRVIVDMFLIILVAIGSLILLYILA